jgi:hypothetical protein
MFVLNLRGSIRAAAVGGSDESEGDRRKESGARIKSGEGDTFDLTCKSGRNILTPDF